MKYTEFLKSLQEADVVARADYKVGASGRKTHREIVFHDGSGTGKEDEEKKEVKEETMTDAEMKKREDIVKGMKKNVAGFKARYGDRAKEVMYATATKLAKEETEIEEGYVVRYNNPKSEKHGSEKHFGDQASAQKHADQGNSVDKIGGKYTVHKTNEKGHDIKEQAPVAPVPDRKYIKGTPEWKAHKEKSKPINGHPTNSCKEEVDLDEAKDTVTKDKEGKVTSWSHEGDWKKSDTKKNPEGKVHNLTGQALKKTKQLAKEETENEETMTKTYSQFMEQLLEYTPGPGGVTRHVGTYGTAKGAKYGNTDYDNEHIEKNDDEEPKKQAEKRGRGRPAGSKSGANQKVTTGKSYGGIATHSLNLPNSNR